MNASKGYGLVGVSAGVSVMPKSIDQMLADIDDKISLLAKYVDEIGTVECRLCGSLHENQALGTNSPMPVPNGLRDKLEEREHRLDLLLGVLGRSTARLLEL